MAKKITIIIEDDSMHIPITKTSPCDTCGMKPPMGGPCIGDCPMANPIIITSNGTIRTQGWKT